MAGWVIDFVVTIFLDNSTACNYENSLNPKRY